MEYSKEEEQKDNAVIDLSSSVKEGKLRMYFFHKFGFLDKSIWNDELTYDQIAMILRKVLGGKPNTEFLRALRQTVQLHGYYPAKAVRG